VILIAAQVLDGIGKGGIYFAAIKFLKDTGLFNRMVRLVGLRRNTFVWIMAAGVILGAPAKAFIVTVWLQVFTTIVDLPRAAWAIYQLRRKRNAATPD
jgi:hypothetical protein